MPRFEMRINKVATSLAQRIRHYAKGILIISAILVVGQLVGLACYYSAVGLGAAFGDAESHEIRMTPRMITATPSYNVE